ncbi:MAG: hypothetical protein LBV18_02090 [Alistipes sp.]|jgi:hypothetical protein|nr:hypothetical protein [Alistipes sp.]
MRELMDKFPDVFGEGDSRESLEDLAGRREEDKDEDDTVMDFCSERWDELPEEEKIRVYRHHFLL